MNGRKLKLLCVALTLACSMPPIVSRSSVHDEKYKNIAMIRGTDQITQVHIRNLLGRDKIAVFMEGSLGYGVSVANDQAAEATKILKVDAAKNKYFIAFADGSKVNPDESSMNDYPVNRKYSDALKFASRTLPAELVAVLRSKDAKDVAKRIPTVTRFHVRVRSYMHKNGKLGSAYEGDLECADPAHKAGAKYYFQVWDGGKEVQWNGGSEWKGDR